MPIWRALTKWLRKDLFPVKRRIWRKVITANPDELEYRRGGEAVMVFVGASQLVLACCWSWLLILISQDELRSEMETFKLTGRYAVSSGEIFNVALEGIFACIIFFKLSLGLLTVFGRARVTIDKTTGLITKSYRLLTVRVFERIFDIRMASSVSFESPTILARMLHAYFVFLQTEGQPPQKLFVYLGSPLHKQGREMANEIATFLGVPGPA